MRCVKRKEGQQQTIATQNKYNEGERDNGEIVEKRNYMTEVV